jgi:hypothetical protein
LARIGIERTCEAPSRLFAIVLLAFTLHINATDATIAFDLIRASHRVAALATHAQSATLRCYPQRSEQTLPSLVGVRSAFTPRTGTPIRPAVMVPGPAV